MFSDELREWREGLRDSYAEAPMETTLQLVAAASAAFFLAERDKNSKVTSYEAALEYVTTSLSVGYSSIFPETPTGKIIGSFLSVVGPSMTAGLMSPSRISEERREDDVSARLIERLDAILLELRSARGTPAPKED